MSIVSGMTTFVTIAPSRLIFLGTALVLTVVIVDLIAVLIDGPRRHLAIVAGQMACLAIERTTDILVTAGLMTGSRDLTLATASPATVADQMTAFLETARLAVERLTMIMSSASESESACTITKTMMLNLTTLGAQRPSSNNTGLLLIAEPRPK